MIKKYSTLICIGIFSVFLFACTSTNLIMPKNQLWQNLSSEPVRLQDHNNELIVTTLVQTAFPGRSSHLSYNMIKILSKITWILQQNPDLKVKINAYTDQQHSPRSNQLVSLRRSMVIADYFRKHGISSDRISTAGLGSANPIADNRTAEGRKQNRRIDIILYG